MEDRVAILDCGRDIANDNLVISHRRDGHLAASRPTPSGYGAFYFPWIEVADPLSAHAGARVAVPPSGHLAGIYARSDAERGVHKAPGQRGRSAARSTFATRSARSCRAASTRSA